MEMARYRRGHTTNMLTQCFNAAICIINETIYVALGAWQIVFWIATGFSVWLCLAESR
jgi:hypothetical protein